MLHDLRFGVRLLRRNPAFAAASILTLTLGIGMTTAIFCVVDAVLVRPVPFPEAERLVLIWETDRDTGTTHEPGSWPDFVDFERRSRRLDRFAGVIAGDATLTPENGEPARVASMAVTHGLLPLLGIDPLVGRTFTPNEDTTGGPAVALISEALWQRVFFRDPGVIGRTLRIDDRPWTVIGVVPADADFGILQVLSAADYSRGFADRDPRSQVDVWMPLQADPERLVRDTHPLIMLGRLAPGASSSAAQEELAAIAADLENTYASNKARGVHVQPLRDVIFGPSRPALLLLLAAVALVLLISCVNVANLLLARGTMRAREVAVRLALGATTRQLLRQFVAENLLLTMVSAVLGMVLAYATLRALLALAPPEVPRLASAAIDARVLALAAVVSIVVGVAFGLLPLRYARKTDLQTALNAEGGRGAAGGREGRITRGSLVVAEVALAVVLVTGAGLLLRSIWHLRQTDPGFEASGVLKAEFQLPRSRYGAPFTEWPNFARVHRFNDLLLERVSALPGVESAAIAVSHPLDAGSTNSFVIVGREQESRDLPEISIRQVSPGYFATLRVQLMRGRLLAQGDGTFAPAVILINEAAAARLFAGGDPVGQQIAFWGARRTIVGVVANERFHGVTSAPPIAAYVPVAQAPPRAGGESLLVRVNREAAASVAAVRTAIRDVDPALAVFGMEPLADTLAASIGTERFVTLLLALFAALALVLAAIGIHGVLSYAVVRRSREIGIRMALGASARGVLRLVVGEAAFLTACGLAAGLVLGLAFSRLLEGLLFGVAATDIPTLAAVVGVLTAVAALATWMPTRRAVRVDPLVVLRQE
jgi:putative ABC transport system permease protein